jgi:hypothetical protein
MSTTGCAEAFTKLVAARDRFRNLTAQTDEAHKHRSASPQAAARYTAVRAEWEAAFREFKVAREKFSVTLRKVQYNGNGLNGNGLNGNGLNGNGLNGNGLNGNGLSGRE